VNVSIDVMAQKTIGALYDPILVSVCQNNRGPTTGKSVNELKGISIAL
jgi:hypothetical protein